MAIKPYVCRRHGPTTAYIHTAKSGVSKGRVVRVCRLCRAEEVKKTWKALKAEVISAYGGRCECCQEATPEFLTIDHTNGLGREHRKAGLRGYRLYDWLKRQGFPKKGYRVLCWNCNCARGQYGECPHKR